MPFLVRRALPYVVSLCVIGALAATPGPAAGQSDHKRVLLLFDEDRSLPGLSVLEQSIRATLSAGLGDDVEFFAESMYAAQFPEAQRTWRCATTTRRSTGPESCISSSASWDPR